MGSSAFFHPLSKSDTMASLNPVAFTTELAAVNRLLSAIGEAPISDLVASTREDVSLACTLLREASMDAQALGWKFNTEWGYEIAPTSTLAWEGTDGTTETLNVWKPPTGTLAFRLTSTAAQAGLDMIPRKSRVYEETGSKVIVLYDRIKNRDGLNSTTYPYLYADLTWFFDWEFLPETARRYIVCRAARQFIQQTVGAQDLAGFGDEDERKTLFALEREQGIEEDISMLDSTDVASVRGGRLSGISGFYDSRKFPAPA